MGKSEVFIAGLMLASVCVTAQAAATTHAEIDWSGMMISTTGDLSYTMETLYGFPRFTRVMTMTSDSLDQSEYMTKTGDGFTATVHNSADMLSSSIDVTGEQIGAIATGIALTGIELTGSGTFTIRVPYELHLTQDGSYLAKGAVSSRIEGTSHLFSREAIVATSPEINYGDPDDSGFFSFVLTGNGGTSNYTMISYVDTQIQPGVPEPETYAMMGLGIGAIWLARRRKA